MAYLKKKARGIEIQNHGQAIHAILACKYHMQVLKQPQVHVKRMTRRGLRVHYPNLKDHVLGLLVIRRGVEIQDYKEAMCTRGALKLQACI